jgi:putative hydrolase of the HAD superfamily
MKNFVFDVGGVLLQNGIAQYLKERMTYKEDAQIVNEEIFHSVERVQLDRGVIGKEEAFEKMLCRIPQRSRKEARDLYDEYMANRKIVCGMVELLEKLKKKGHKLYVLSNFGVDFDEIIKKNNFEFFKLFDGVFVSCFYQTVKPEGQIFDAFLRKYGLEATDCFFIDDKEENVEAAIYKGFSGFVFRGDVNALEAYIQETEAA